MAANGGKDTFFIKRNSYRIAVTSVSTAVLFGLVAASGAGTTQATVSTAPALIASGFSELTNPPGPCDPEEIGQDRIGPDGNRYTCTPGALVKKFNNEVDGNTGAVADARRLKELASDPTLGGNITSGSMRQAQVALALEKAGRLPGPVTRDPTGAADFIDGRGVEWNVESVSFKFPPSHDGYELATSITKIGAELLPGQHIILDTTNFSAEATATLQEAVGTIDHGHHVLFWPLGERVQVWAR
jgi:hypothetical protein